jgi:two-component system, chemotaxis family, response regulator Rcp1
MLNRTILLIEDNSGDQRLTVEALRLGSGVSSLQLVGDGVEALDYLKRRGKYAAAPRPALIILDLNLPRKDGREVLAEVKNDSDLRRIPIVVLTTSKADEDIWKSYDSHANCFVTKPNDWDEFLATLNTIETFWLSIVELP